MKNLTKLLPGLFAAVIPLGMATFAMADPKPGGAKNMDPNAVIDIYLGKTWEWSKGGAYWGGGGAFQAVLDEDPNDPSVSYTDGKWYVTSKGTLCYDTVWKWSTMTASDGAGAQVKNCWLHVVDADGQVWRSDHENQRDFHRINFDRIKSGNQIKRTYDQYKRQAGS
jgi:hypothetical protein